MLLGAAALGKTQAFFVSCGGAGPLFLSAPYSQGACPCLSGFWRDKGEDFHLECRPNDPVFAESTNDPLIVLPSPIQSNNLRCSGVQFS